VNGASGGKLVIHGGKLVLEKTGENLPKNMISANHSGSGAGPDLDIRTTESVSTANGSIHADVTGSGAGGRVVVETRDINIKGEYTGEITLIIMARVRGLLFSSEATGNLTIDTGYVNTTTSGVGHGATLELKPMY